MSRRITIFGSTGSIGASALKVVREHPGELEVAGLAAHSNVDELARQIEEFHPTHVAVADSEAAAQLRARFPKVAISDGQNSVADLAAMEVDVALFGMVGSVGLRAILTAIASGNCVALANKEPMVMAGRLIMSEAARRGVTVLPVDSEHNAIFQCLQGNAIEDVRRVYLTASGGPFYGRSRESLRDVSAEEAANHPTWDMGAKISIDSATLMNKGLEIIEAMWLFGLPLETVEVLVHPQSVVHGLVEFNDGHILAHMGLTDMTLPIQFALMWPNRVESPMGRLDLTAIQSLSFAAPDFSEFPCLGHARAAAKQGGTAGAVLNAANEVAVEAFLARRIPFPAIAQIVEQCLDAGESRGLIRSEGGLKGILNVDAEARQLAHSLLDRYV